MLNEELYHIKDDKMGRIYSTYGCEEKCVQDFGRES